MGRILKVNGVIEERGFIVKTGKHRLRANRLCVRVKKGSLGPASGWS